jgi:hypothetical protein
MIRARTLYILIPGLIAFLLGPSGLFAQELTPKTFANTPVGMNYLAVGYAFSHGNTLLDPALPIEDLDADINIAFIRYIRTAALFDSAAKVKVLVPFSWGHWDGLVEGVPEDRDASGIGDAKLSLEFNFLGAPALSASEFNNYEKKTIMGATLTISAPTGDYDDTKLINIGSNRWYFKGEVGVSHVMGNWTLEAAGGIWLFTRNNDFFNGRTLSQAPLYTLKGHIIYTLKPGFWFALGVGYGEGGRTKVDGVKKDTYQRNWRYGLTMAYPIKQQHGLVFSIFSGDVSGTGSKFDSFGFAYQYAWGGD